MTDKPMGGPLPSHSDWLRMTREQKVAHLAAVGVEEPDKYVDSVDFTMLASMVLFHPERVQPPSKTKH